MNRTSLHARTPMRSRGPRLARARANDAASAADDVVTLPIVATIATRAASSRARRTQATPASFRPGPRSVREMPIA
jgi:hypothetical protein